MFMFEWTVTLIIVWLILQKIFIMIFRTHLKTLLETSHLCYPDTCTSPAYPYRTDTILVLVLDTTPKLIGKKIKISYLQNPLFHLVILIFLLLTIKNAKGEKTMIISLIQKWSKEEKENRHPYPCPKFSKARSHIPDPVISVHIHILICAS